MTIEANADADAGMGARGEPAPARRRPVLSAPLTRAKRAAREGPRPAADGDVLRVVPRTFPFPPTRGPLALGFAAKNAPRKALLKRWRARPWQLPRRVPPPALSVPQPPVTPVTPLDVRPVEECAVVEAECAAPAKRPVSVVQDMSPI